MEVARTALEAYSASLAAFSGFAAGGRAKEHAPIM